MSSRPSRLRQLYYQWRMLKLPWRKTWLVGFDLSGNTFWEFKDQLNAQRLRRIVKYGRNTHYGDVNVSPQWLQWLRHTRFEPPSILEQQYDVSRQERMKVLAAEADTRWASTPSRLDAPTQQEQLQGVVSSSTGGKARDRPGNVDVAAGSTQEAGFELPPPVTSSADARPALKRDPKERSSPFKAPSKGPGEDWQPEAWSPGPAKRR